jgi:hypothetical protein
MNPIDETLMFFLTDLDRLRSRWASIPVADASEPPRTAIYSDSRRRSPDRRSWSRTFGTGVLSGPGLTNM